MKLKNLGLLQVPWYWACRNPLVVTESLSAFAQILAVVERYDPSERQKGGINDRKVMIRYQPNLDAKLIEISSSERALRLTMLIRLAASVTLLIGHKSRMRTIATGFIAGSYIITNKFSHNGSDGADQLMAVNYLATFLGRLAGPKGQNLAVDFISAQVCLSYAASGFAKVFGREWMNGTAVERIMRTHSYGDKWFYTNLRSHPEFGRFLTHSTVLFELFFPLLVRYRTTRTIALIVMALFHAANVQFMGLGRFFIAFVSCFPAIEASAKRHGR